MGTDVAAGVGFDGVSACAVCGDDLLVAVADAGGAAATAAAAVLGKGALALNAAPPPAPSIQIRTVGSLVSPPVAMMLAVGWHATPSTTSTESIPWKCVCVRGGGGTTHVSMPANREASSPAHARFQASGLTGVSFQHLGYFAGLKVPQIDLVVFAP